MPRFHKKHLPAGTVRTVPYAGLYLEQIKSKYLEPGIGTVGADGRNRFGNARLGVTVNHDPPRLLGASVLRWRNPSAVKPVASTYSMWSPRIAFESPSELRYKGVRQIKE